jgi:hypothetical protein
MDEQREFFKTIIKEHGLDEEVIFKALHDTLELGLVDWGDHRELIEAILYSPDARNIYTLIANSHVILKPLQDWITVERHWIVYKRESIPPLEYIERKKRCYQVLNFIIAVKLY